MTNVDKALAILRDAGFVEPWHVRVWEVNATEPPFRWRACAVQDNGAASGLWEGGASAPTPEDAAHALVAAWADATDYAAHAAAAEAQHADELQADLAAEREHADRLAEALREMMCFTPDNAAQALFRRVSVEALAAHAARRNGGDT